MKQLFFVTYAIDQSENKLTLGTIGCPYQNYVTAKDLPAALDILRMSPGLGGRFELIVLEVKRLGLIIEEGV